VLDGKLTWTFAGGVANAHTGTPLTHAHRGRFASHSKTFTAAAFLLLRERGLLQLDDKVGNYVSGLHKDLASARLEQLLSHSAGVVRDGSDSGQFQDRRPYLSAKELLTDLKKPPPLRAGTQLKYSNHGYGLLGLVLEKVTETPYCTWMHEHILRPCKLSHTSPDFTTMQEGALFANGHTGLWPYGRHVIPADNACQAMAPAAGFVSTASDMATFFAQLSPAADHSILSAESRREMVRRRWQDTGSAESSHYGLGMMSGGQGKKEWFGHSGGFQGVVSRTAHFPATGITLSALCNANDGMAWPWLDGVYSILSTFRENGAPSLRVRDWGGRWWSHWGEYDLVPVGDKVLGISPAATTPMHDFVDEFRIEDTDHGLTVKGSAYNRPGEALVRIRDKAGKVIGIRNGGTLMSDRATIQKEISTRYTRAG
jgi:D-alanyl-D-alanine carboxypeptidase